jgi:type IV fimbrial biogenesis protein FimT
MRGARGFTVVEMMITIAVLGILLVAGVPAMRGVIENSRIRAGGEALKYGLTLARNEAVRRNAQVDFAVVATGWEVRTVIGGEVLHRGSGQEAAGGLQLTLAPEGADTVTFDPFGRVMDPNPDGLEPFTQIDVEAANPPGVPGYRPLRVQVLDSGVARLCDPAAADDDPQACL